MDQAQRLTLLLRRTMHVTPRGAAEFLLVAAALTLAEPTASSLLIGGAFSLLGALVRMWASGYSSDKGILAYGPFLWLRHPYLLGSSLIFFGLGLASANAYVLAAMLILLPLMYWSSYQRADARYKLALGPWFPSYQDHVPALLPRLLPSSMGRLAPGGPKAVKPKFSLEYALLRGRHRELDALVVGAVVALCLYLLQTGGAKPWQHGAGIGTVVLLSLARFVYYATVRRPAQSSPRA